MGSALRFAAAILALAVAAANAAQTPTTAMSQRPLSPSVFASILTRGGQLVLLVLWRGTPGWYWRANGGSGGGGGTGDRMFQDVREGGLTFRIAYDFASGTAQIAGQPIVLAATNVALVDAVDGPSGPVIVARRRTDPSVSEPLHPEAEVIRRHADLYEFLQCDLLLPRFTDTAAPLKEAMLASSCAQLKP
jgi:hypothetical protein